MSAEFGYFLTGVFVGIAVGACILLVVFWKQLKGNALLAKENDSLEKQLDGANAKAEKKETAFKSLITRLGDAVKNSKDIGKSVGAILDEIDNGDNKKGEKK